MSHRLLALALLAALLPAPALADGEVQIPIGRYDELIQATTAQPAPAPAPAGYAFGTATVDVTVASQSGAGSAEVALVLPVEVLTDGWQAVPVLPAGTAVTSAMQGGIIIQLVHGPDGLAWPVKTAGKHTLNITYTVDATRFDDGAALSVPLPRTSARLKATVAGAGPDLAAIPSSGAKSGGSGVLLATVPAGPGVQISWRTARHGSHVLSRATYTGALQGDAIRWTGEFSVDSTGDTSTKLPLLPADIALVDLRVDGDAAPIVVEDGRFAAGLVGAGRHTVTAVFETPITRDEGPPRVDLRVPRVPVSRFELTLPGDKDVTVTPAGQVAAVKRGGSTVSRVNVAMTDSVSFTWSEAIPVAAATEVRANAGLYHAVHAEEGVLHVRASAVFEVTRGETSQFELAVPGGVQINRVGSSSGGVADWRMARSGPDAPGLLTVFVDRKVTGEFAFDVHYERLIGTATDTELPVPLLSARGVHRQRGMVALLGGKELTLEPRTETNLSRVGENQLPAFVKQSIERTIAHTFKYASETPELTAAATVPERRQGRFDAQVDTLISLGDVTMGGAATVEVNVKSGSITELDLTLPAGVNFLSLTAPSLRSHDLTAGDPQTIAVAFTQEMEGQFRIEVKYERIMGDAEGEVVVPTLSVRGAEVEQGRIAVEALSAVEVQASTTTQLSSVDVGELPQQLILRTTNPILLAFKYVHVDPPYTLGLKITRHREIDVQAATIDEAVYSTLVTRDGLAVTTARFDVRNRQEQFLRVRLPAGAEVWSASVNGVAEKPALAEGEAAGAEVLIKIINSERAFPVQVIYATPTASMGWFGRVRLALPLPDMVATTSRLSVFLPTDLRYGEPTGNMDPTVQGQWVAADGIRAEVGDESGPAPLIAVPQAGMRFEFQKLYANQGGREAWVAIPYSSPWGGRAASLLSLLGGALFWGSMGLAALRRRGRRPVGEYTVAGAGVLGVALPAFAILYLDTSPDGLLVLSLAVVAAAAGAGLFLRFRRKDRWDAMTIPLHNGDPEPDDQADVEVDAGFDHDVDATDDGFEDDEDEDISDDDDEDEDDPRG